MCEYFINIFKKNYCYHQIIDQGKEIFRNIKNIEKIILNKNSKLKFTKNQILYKDKYLIINYQKVKTTQWGFSGYLESKMVNFKKKLTPISVKLDIFKKKKKINNIFLQLFKQFRTNLDKF